MHLSLLRMLSNGFKTYFGISDMIMICGIHLHRTCKKLSKTKDMKFLGISVLLLRIKDHCFCTCENNPCIYSTLYEDWSLFTSNYCFYKENLALEHNDLEFQEP